MNGDLGPQEWEQEKFERLRAQGEKAVRRAWEAVAAIAFLALAYLFTSFLGSKL